MTTYGYNNIIFTLCKEYCIAGKFGGEFNLAVLDYNRQIKVRQYFLHAYIAMYGDTVPNRQI